MENSGISSTSSSLFNIRKRGLLKIEATSRSILWIVDSYPFLLTSEKIVCSDTFRVPTLTSCLFYLSLSICEKTCSLIVVRFAKNRCFSSTDGKLVNVSFVLKDDSNNVLVTKDMVMTKDVSAAVQFEMSNNTKFSNESRLEIQCTITKPETDVGFQIQKSDGHASSGKIYVPTISIAELKDHLQVILEGNEEDRVTIFIDNQEFQVHKSIICSNSPVFAAMFEYDTQEKTTNQISIDDISAETIGEVFSFMYFGSTSQLSHKMAMNVYRAADKYAMINLKRKCSNFLITHLEKDFVLDALVLADRHGDDELMTSAIRFLVDKSGEVIESDEFLVFLETESQLARRVFTYLANIAAKCSGLSVNLCARTTT